jgi:septal ring factor EnvC (AmiA/AmiB activator)
MSDSVDELETAYEQEVDQLQKTETNCAKITQKAFRQTKAAFKKNAELKQQNAEIKQRNAEIKQQNAELMQQNAELKQHNTTTKNELNATISRLEYEIATLSNAITTLRCRGYTDENARPAKKQVTATATAPPATQVSSREAFTLPATAAAKTLVDVGQDDEGWL